MLIRTHHIIVGLVIFLITQGCLYESPGQVGSQYPDHEVWDELLQKHIDEKGFVKYNGFISDSLQLNLYLDQLQKHPPDKQSWTTEEQLAYWINAYNAFTIKLIIDNYPLESIKDIGSGIQIPFVSSPWDIKFIKIGGKKLDLNNIEHSILRKEFDEPRIHFAVNCASFSCPKLRGEAFVASKLDMQLDEQARDFINDLERNAISKDQVQVSKIFSWFKGDFTKAGSLREYLNQYSRVKIREKTKIKFMDYDWSLNQSP